MGRLKIGEGSTEKGEVRSTSFSKRCALQKLTVSRRLCPICGHHKVLINSRGVKCARCKRYIKK